MDRHRKMDKHFTIKVNNQSVKILKFKTNSYYNDFDGEVNFIEIITKIPNKVLDQREVVIEIDGEEIIIATWYLHFSKPGLHRYSYKISK
jgi:hypothetical protein